MDRRGNKIGGIGKAKRKEETRERERVGGEQEGKVLEENMWNAQEKSRSGPSSPILPSSLALSLSLIHLKHIIYSTIFSLLKSAFMM